MKELVEFSSILSSLLNSSLGIRDSLDLLKVIGREKKMQYLAARLIDRIDMGKSFASAVEQEGNSFPPIIGGLINIGERTGDLAKSFNRIASYATEKRKMQASISGAMAYPILVLVVLFLGIIFLAIFALPKLRELFMGMGGNGIEELSLIVSRIKRSVIVLSILMVIIISLIITILLVERSSGKARQLLDSMVLRLPIVGKYLIDSNTLDFLFAMESLVSAGISIDDALEESISSISNVEYGRIIRDIRNEIRKGFPLSASFGKHKLLPNQLSQWLSVGERTGSVDLVFSQLRSYYQDAISRWTTVFTNLMEPLISVCVGLFIITIVVMFVLPLLSAYGSML
ncbi:MAG: type II secretion system F family protein [Bacilli bacterium]|nr:type II secretion system F family protein [Bacilli bacterium]